MTPHRLRLVAACLTLVGLIACGPSGPSGPGAETLAALRLTVVDALLSETATTIVVTAIGNRGSDPLAGFTGTATLELDAGSVTPASVGLADGSGSAEVVVGGHVGTVTLTARIGSVSTSATIDLQPIGIVPGDPAANAADALPWLPFVGREEDYRDDAPDVPGLMLSFRAAGAVLHEDATIGQLNDLLARYGAGIAGFGPGLPGQFGPTLTLWLPTADPTAMAAAIAELREEPLLDHVHRRFLLEPYEELPEAEAEIAAAAVGPTGEKTLAAWTWEREDQPQPEADANWGYERIRVPQMWNLNGGAEVASRAQRAEPWVAIIDGTAIYDHPDLRLTASPPTQTSPPYTADKAKDNDHATHVGGTIAATFNNREGIEGINPFANLMHQPGSRTAKDYGLTTLMVLTERIRVINMSLGIPWNKGTINPNTSPAKQREVTAAGGELAHVLAARRAFGNPVPIIVVSAGNDSSHPNLGGARIEARWNSPMANAALVHGDPGILVVEAVGRDGNGTIARAAFSNAGGHVSAPGVAIVSAGATLPYLPLQGTSMAAPHVSGVASYLLALRPEATNEQVIRAILETAEPVAGAAPLIDAFAAAMALDTILGGYPLALHALLDVDDGTLDGNQRVDPFTGGEVPHEQDAFGPRGDGVIDMRDFRRFRDALLFVEGDVALDLDGSAFHPKRDLDLDGFVAIPAEENVFPRFDFNGDGLISRHAGVLLPGYVGEVATDLQVLQALWDDPDVAAEDLPDLLDSGDVHLDERAKLADPDIAAVAYTFVRAGDAAEWHVRLDDDRPQRVVTLPVGEYDVERVLLDPQDEEVSSRTRTLTVTLGGDLALEEPVVTPQRVLSAGQFASYYVRPDGTMLAWGWNGWYQLGDGSDTDRLVPGPVATLGNATTTTAGRFTAFAVRTTGGVSSWGTGSQGQLGDGVEWDKGTTCSGIHCNRTPTPVLISDVKQVAIGSSGNTVVAVLTDGRVWTWGSPNTFVTGNRSFDDCTGGFACPTPALMPFFPAGAIDVVDASANHALAIDQQGRVWAWGMNESQQLGLADPVINRAVPVLVGGFPAEFRAVAVAAGSAGVTTATPDAGFSVAVGADGSVWTWGSNDRGQLGGGTVGGTRATPARLTGIADVVAVSAGLDHVLALTRDGALYAWGSNARGQAGTGTAASSVSTPVLVLAEVDAIAAGSLHSLARKLDGSVWAWGMNEYGQVGDGTKTDRRTPVEVIAPPAP